MAKKKTATVKPKKASKPKFDTGHKAEEPMAEAVQTNPEFEVKRVGWASQNDVKGVILLSAKERRSLDVGLMSIVKVNNGDKSALAFVHKQFRDLLNMDRVCSVNNALARQLEVAEGSKVTISKVVTETEARNFMYRGLEA